MYDHKPLQQIMKHNFHIIIKFKLNKLNDFL